MAAFSKWKGRKEGRKEARIEDRRKHVMLLPS
jgi:hypothetical protein